jgi:hypothetical protein
MKLPAHIKKHMEPSDKCHIFTANIVHESIPMIQYWPEICLQQDNSHLEQILLASSDIGLIKHSKKQKNEFNFRNECV